MDGETRRERKSRNRSSRGRAAGVVGGIGLTDAKGGRNLGLRGRRDVVGSLLLFSSIVETSNRSGSRSSRRRRREDAEQESEREEQGGERMMTAGSGTVGFREYL